MISIITINYNNAKGLDDTIRSVIGQSIFDKIEYIVIDGNSTDESVDIIQEYKDKLSFWVSEPDSGIYNAMNKGVQYATGEYCLFLNSGDTLLNNSVIERAAIYSWVADVISCDLFKDSGHHNHLKAPDSVSVLYFIHHSLPHPSTFIRTKLLHEYPYDESYKIVSDWIFFYDRLGMDGCSYQHLPITLTLFRMDGISTRKFEMHQLERRRFLCTRMPEPLVNDLTKSQLYSVYLYYLNWLTKPSKSILDFCFYKIMRFDHQIIKPIQAFYHKCKS